jgi:hypothetical protein
MDADLIDPRRDRVWAVDVTMTYTTYVVAESADAALEIAEEAADEDRALGTDDDYVATELTETVSEADGIVAWGHSLHDGQQVTVNEAVELVAPHRPVRDTLTLLMPFIHEPPAERPEAR